MVVSKFVRSFGFLEFSLSHISQQQQGYKIRGQLERSNMSNTVDSRYLELQGTLWNSSRYPYFDISDLRTQENN